MMDQAEALKLGGAYHASQRSPRGPLEALEIEPLF
jgi:hypothetical protein